MSKRIGIFVMFTLSGAFALVWGLVLARSARDIILDYRVEDLGARCLLQHRDLYNRAEMMRVYGAETGDASAMTTSPNSFMPATQVYLPPAELIFAPFAMLRWPAAYFLWISTTFILLVLATFLVWDVARLYAPNWPFYLGCVLLANSGILFSGGNSAGVAVSLCVIAFWCFHRKRFEWAGVICLAISLAIKPHDSGLVWLYVFLLGGTFRKQAVRVLALCTMLSLGAILWISQVSPNWIQELRANLALSNRSFNGPGFGNAALMINLQGVVAAFRNRPQFYDPVVYMICAPLLLLWIYVTIRIRQTPKAIWIGVATVAALSLLPVYHRPYDAKILLLTFPACAALWAEGGTISYAAMALTAGGILATSDMPVAMLCMLEPKVHSMTGVANGLILVMTTRPAPVILLAMCTFYLWAYLRLYRNESTERILSTSELQ